MSRAIVGAPTFLSRAHLSTHAHPRNLRLIFDFAVVCGLGVLMNFRADNCGCVSSERVHRNSEINLSTIPRTGMFPNASRLVRLSTTHCRIAWPQRDQPRTLNFKQAMRIHALRATASTAKYVKSFTRDNVSNRHAYKHRKRSSHAHNTLGDHSPALRRQPIARHLKHPQNTLLAPLHS